MNINVSLYPEYDTDWQWQHRNSRVIAGIPVPVKHSPDPTRPDPQQWRPDPTRGSGRVHLRVRVDPYFKHECLFPAHNLQPRSYIAECCFRLFRVSPKKCFLLVGFPVTSGRRVENPSNCPKSCPMEMHTCIIMLGASNLEQRRLKTRHS